MNSQNPMMSASSSYFHIVYYLANFTASEYHLINKKNAAAGKLTSSASIDLPAFH
jgi:hypothetical protein